RRLRGWDIRSGSGKAILSWSIRSVSTTRHIIDDGGHPHTDAYHSTERFHRRDFGHMEYEITIDDPKAYTRPWKVIMPFEFFPDNELMESVCENEKDFERLVGK